MSKYDVVLDYIKANWEKSVYKDEEGTGFMGVDLPYRYTCPSIKDEGHFSFFFYWDTYFTNLGLLTDGHSDVAKENIMNMMWFIKRQGFMPNHVGLYNRSQSPYLCRMVRDYINRTGDDSMYEEWAYGLKQEYYFWANARFTPIGLNHYAYQDTAENCAEFYDMISNRMGFDKDIPVDQKAEIGGHFLANAEATCDFSNRFNYRCLDYVEVDLNALLYEYEEYLLECSKNLGWKEESVWEERMIRRKELINKYMWNDQAGLFYDYDFVNKNFSPVPALTGLQVMSSGIATKEQAERMKNNLDLFEREYGIAYTPETSDCRKFQWAYPAVWPPMVYMTVEGLLKYGYEDDAKRIAVKYLDTTLRLFEETGKLWEKTDAETGSVYNAEYNAAAMLGWTAGIFVYLCSIFFK